MKSKIKITKEQLLDLFKSKYLNNYVEGIIIDEIISELPLVEDIKVLQTNFRTSMAFIYLEFYRSLGKETFIELVKNKLKEELEDIIPSTEDEFTITDALLDSTLEELDDLIEDKVAWFEKQLARNIFEPTYEIIPE